MICKNTAIPLAIFISLMKLYSSSNVFLINLLHFNLPPLPDNSRRKYKYKKKGLSKIGKKLFRKSGEKIVSPIEIIEREKLRLRIIYVIGLISVFFYAILDYILAFFLVVKIIYSSWDFDEIETIGVGAIIGGFAGGFVSTFFQWLQKVTVSFPLDMKKISKKHLRSLLILLSIVVVVYGFLAMLIIYIG